MADAQPDILAIFTEAVGHESPAERSQFLDEACRSNPLARQRVETLLRAHFDAGNFLGGHFPAATTTIDQPVAEISGMPIGPYKLIEQIGEGGMGTVWMAQQTEPVRRMVALKIIKPGMDTRQVIARFAAERQALSLMDHPNIAKVLDAGTTGERRDESPPVDRRADAAPPAGRPYFVMELVKGRPITQYCDEKQLTPRQRLELFVSVCQAIQHAHQKGIIHRDIKPTNILVAEYDQQPVPKVIDFGVAKAISQPLTEKTMFTGFGQIVGTLEYMSPEQAKVNQLDIDTRSDIYSLGVVLYELLTGTTPFDRQRLQSAALDEVLRIIREEEPPRPSTKISASDTLASIAANRRVEPARLTRLVRGELDWIVMKTLEKDRSRRYESASSLAMDVQRYLRDEPVLAGPPSAWYRFRKLAQRNKAGMMTAMAMALAVLLAVGSLTVSYLRIGRSLTQEKQAKDDLVQTLYYQWVASSANQRAKNRPALAEELLEQCPIRLRGWEWYYVKRLPFTEILKLRHDDIINRVAWSPDGRFLASGSLKGWVKVWDARTGALQFRLDKAQKKFVMGLAFSPDSRLLATGGEDDRVNLWDVTSGKLVRQFPTGPGTTMLQALEFSPDGSQLAAADQDRHVRLWNVADGREVRLSDDLIVPWGLAFTAGGRHLITVSADGAVKILNVSDRRTVAAYRASTRAVGYRAAFSRDRQLLALGCEDGTIKILNTEPLLELRTLRAHTGEVTGLAFGADDTRLASAADDLTVKIWDLRTGQQALSLDIVSRRANGLAFSPSSHRLAVGSADGTLQILDGTPLDGPGDGGQLRTLESHADAVVGLAYSPDGGRIASASRDGTAKIWDAESGHELTTFRGHQAALTSVVWTPNGRTVASASWDGTVRVWDAATGDDVLPPLDAKAGPVYGIAFHRNGSVLATSHHDGTVRVWDAVTGQMRVLIHQAHTQAALGVTFRPDREHLVSAGGKDNFVKFWDWQADPNKPVLELVAPENIIRNPVFSPEGRYLAAVVATPARVWTWDMTESTGAGTPRPLPQAWKASQAVFRPGGRLAVVSGGRIQFLESDGSEGPALVERHAGEILCAAFSPDGRRLATGAGFKGRGEIRIWDASQWEKTP